MVDCRLRENDKSAVIVRGFDVGHRLPVCLPSLPSEWNAYPTRLPTCCDFGSGPSPCENAKTLDRDRTSLFVQCRFSCPGGKPIQALRVFDFFAQAWPNITYSIYFIRASMVD